jgi:hypothetical protein
MGDRAFVYVERSVAFEVSDSTQALARYVERPLRSGYALHPEKLAGEAALVRVAVSEGQVVLFGFPPQHRGQTHGTFKLLFNALLLSGLD